MTAVFNLEFPKKMWTFEDELLFPITEFQNTQADRTLYIPSPFLSLIFFFVL
jgi:hypothetical protein